MSQKLHVVFASAEAAPFVKTGGLGDVAGSLPAALVRAGANVVVMVPKYATIAEEYKNRMTHAGSFYVPLGWRNEYCGLERLDIDGVTYLFLDNEHYFGRSYPYGFFDDGERFAFFSKAICESLQYLPEGLGCDILHCNDWHTALAPVFLREFYQGIPLYEHVRTVFSIHNIAFQGQFSDAILNDILGMAHIPAAARQLRCDERSINYMLGALNYADAISTVSPTYANEIRTPEFGEGLDGVLRRREHVLTGILNGIDTAAFNPATDPRITATYTAADRSGKAACKSALQAELGLTVRDDQPLMVMVTRLTRQKGLDLVMYALDRILSGGVQVAVLGTGDADYEQGLRHFENTYRGQMAACIQFDPALSQRMYSGADMFLMPSLFEPCGLSQIISMRYGTLPIVRETGGLKDTVIPYNQYTGEGTGFSFTHFNGDEMGDAVFRAARLFWDNRDAWNQLVDQAMAADFSWTRSANAYLDLYYGLHPEIDRAARVETSQEKKTDAKQRVSKTATEKKAPSTARTVKKTSRTAASAKKSTSTSTAAKKTTSKTTTRAKQADTQSTPEESAGTTTRSTTRTTKKATTTAKKATATASTSRTSARATTTKKSAASATTVAKSASENIASTKATASSASAIDAPAKSASSTSATPSRATGTTKTSAAASPASKTAVKTAAATQAAPSAPAARTTAAPAKKASTSAAKTTTASANSAAPQAAEHQPQHMAPTPKGPEAPSTPKPTRVSAARKTTTRKKR